MGEAPRHESWMRAFARWRGLTWGDDASAFDPSFIEIQHAKLRRWFGPGAYFDVQASGFEHLPEGGALLVGNHSGGTLALDGFGFASAWYEHHGPTVPLHGLVHELVFAFEGTGSYLAKGGMVRADKAVASRLLAEEGRKVLVMPGGDREVWRPSRRRDRVNFAGRTGYAKLALELVVPIVPVGHVGAHDTFWVLTDGHRLAERVRVIRWIARADIFPVALSFPWGLQVGPWPHLPPPTLFQYRLGAPIDPAQVADAPDPVAALDAKVRFAVEGLIAHLRTERPRRRDRIAFRARQVRDALLRRRR